MLITLVGTIDGALILEDAKLFINDPAGAHAEYRRLLVDELGYAGDLNDDIAVGDFLGELGNQNIVLQEFESRPIGAHSLKTLDLLHRWAALNRINNPRKGDYASAEAALGEVLALLGARDAREEHGSPASAL